MTFPQTRFLHTHHIPLLRILSSTYPTIDLSLKITIAFYINTLYIYIILIYECKRYVMYRDGYMQMDGLGTLENTFHLPVPPFSVQCVSYQKIKVQQQSIHVTARSLNISPFLHFLATVSMNGNCAPKLPAS